MYVLFVVRVYYKLKAIFFFVLNTLTLVSTHLNLETACWDGVYWSAKLPSINHILWFQARTVAALSGSGNFIQIFQTDFSNLHLRMLGISPYAESNDVLTKFRIQYKSQCTV